MQTSGLIAVLATAMGVFLAPSAGAVTLSEVLDKVDGGALQRPPCLEIEAEPVPPVAKPLGDCAAYTVAQLYLGLLRDRARLDIQRNAIADHRTLLDAIQERIASGIGFLGESLLGEVELKRWQVREAELEKDIRKAELFFADVLASDPSSFQEPKPSAAVWPQDEAAALAALAERPTISAEDRQAAKAALRFAWADHEALRREIVLLEPMRAFAFDLLTASRQSFDIGQTDFSTLQRHARDFFDLEGTLVAAKYRQLATQIWILELLGHRDALE